jgi:RHS repeat-associated protein
MRMKLITQQSILARTCGNALGRRAMQLLVLALFVIIGLSASHAWAINETTYYHYDALGSPVAATDASGKVNWREDYTPYGERIRKPTNTTNNNWYTGKPEESALGLQYFGARWYDPALGRFTGIDPVGFKYDNIQSFNRYAYAANNPYKYIDPDGKDWILIYDNTIRWYPGKLGEIAKPQIVCNVASGKIGYQSPEYMNKSEKGPTPDADYEINLIPNPKRIAKRIASSIPEIPNGLRPSADGGIEEIKPVSRYDSINSLWGTRRAKLDPKSGKNPYGRGSLYLHNSNKDYTSGCTETCNAIFIELNDYRDQGNKSIDVRISSDAD